jgi:hypothetical protein
MKTSTFIDTSDINSAVAGAMVNLVDVEVEFSVGTVFREFAQQYVNRITMVSQYDGYDVTTELRNFMKLPTKKPSEGGDAADILYDYFQQLLLLRVLQVNSERGCYIKPSNFGISIPVYIHFILSQIGRVTISERQVRLTPAYQDYDFYSDVSWDANAVLRLSEFLRFKLPGSLAKALPKDLDGDSDFMTFCVIEGVVLNDRQGLEPVLAFAASFLEAKRDADALTVHVKYAAVDYYKHMVPLVVGIGT